MTHSSARHLVLVGTVLALFAGPISPSHGAAAAPAVTCSLATGSTPEPGIPVASPKPEDIEIRPSDRPPQGSSTTWKGTWEEVDTGSGFVGPRTDPIVRVDDYETYEAAIWGGVGPDGEHLMDGALFDAERESSVPMLPAPMCPRTEYAVDGRQLLVYGGRDDQGHWLDDGAMYERGSGRWWVLPPSGLPGGVASTTDGLVVVRDEATGLATASRIIWDWMPVGWTLPSAVPLPPSVRHTLLATERDRIMVIGTQADGTSMVVINDGPARYPRDPRADTNGWHRAVSLPADLGTVAGVARGWALEQDMGVLLSEGPGGQQVTRLDRWHAGHRWVSGRSAPAEHGLDDDLVLSPDHLVSPAALTAYDLLHDRWQVLPPLSGDDFVTITGPGWWFDGSLFAFATTTRGEPRMRLERFKPFLPRGTYRLSGRQGPPPECQSGGSGTWRLRGLADDRELVWLEQGGKRAETTWSDGWTVTFRPLRIRDTTGKVVARGGDRYGMCGSGG